MRTRSIAAVALVAAALAVVGCKNDDMNHDRNASSMSMQHDDCAHCPGVQTATADGKCPVCGMQVKNTNGTMMEHGQMNGGGMDHGTMDHHATTMPAM